MRGARPGAERKLSGKEEALLIATACSKPPAGRARWTLELLAGEMVSLTGHDSLSRETVRRRLADNDLKPWQRKMWCIPRLDADYVARMEDVLDLYAEAPDPKRPVVCFDESPRNASFDPSSTIAASGRSASDQSIREAPPALVSPETPALMIFTSIFAALSRSSSTAGYSVPGGKP